MARLPDGWVFIPIMKDAITIELKQMELITCRHCKYCVEEPNGELYCDILAVGYEPLGSKKVSGDWFCADGEEEDAEM